MSWWWPFSSSPKSDPIWRQFFAKVASNPKLIAEVGGGALIGLILLEHTARVRKWPEYSWPSSRLTQFYTLCQSGWQKVGSGFAIISSYLIHLKLGELGVSIGAVVKPLLGVTLSPTEILIGYATTMHERYKQPMLVVAGSALILGAGAGIAYKYKQLVK